MNRVDLVAVAAHPDDAEVGCGGMLALTTRASSRAVILDLTRGELSTNGTPGTRAEEACSAANILGVRRHNLGLPDGEVGTSPGHRDALADALRTFRPRVLLAPYPDGDRHPDHAAAGVLARQAAFLSGLAKRGTGTPHRPARVYHYQMHHPFPPSLVVDITAVWDVRSAAIAAYDSQFHQDEDARTTAIDGTDFRDALTARARMLGGLIGARYGEAYYCEGPVGLRTLPDLEGADPDPRTYRAFL
ncbi:bacillithiol biosynthesis deacetylase BshB1 [Streptomyces sp. NPDC057910]|uniref:bacillithiol biosynthesis deacetylase BshB1 n=1 Tax=Streptomyces sp. NPDC057910 TaxID=3346278 RepID=UPI0036F0E057